MERKRNPKPELLTISLVLMGSVFLSGCFGKANGISRNPSSSSTTTSTNTSTSDSSSNSSTPEATPTPTPTPTPASGPSVSALVINSSAATTDSTTVSVTFAHQNADEICIRDDGIQGNCVWSTNLASPQNFTFSSSSLGVKTITVWVRDTGTSTVSSPTTDTIQYVGPSVSVSSVSIASGASTTTSRNVNISFSLTNADRICIQESSDSAGCSWSAVITSPQSFTLSAGAIGNRTVYVFGKDNTSGNTSSAGSDSITLSCPTNYVYVAANAALGTNAFCVAQYEMKLVEIASGNLVADALRGGNCATFPSTSTYRAEARNDGVPYVCANRTEANSQCSTAVSGGALISNPQWQAMAREIESIGSNWSGGSVGSGALFRGHTDNSPTSPQPISSTSDPYTDTNSNHAGQAMGSGREQRRTYSLNLNQTIWDVSGNVSEMVSTNLNGSSLSPTIDTGNVEFNAAAFHFTSGASNRLLFAPLAANPTHYTITQNMGLVVGGTNGAAIRGASFTSGTDAGPFHARLDVGASSRSNNTGFRCTTSAP